MSKIFILCPYCAEGVEELGAPAAELFELSLNTVIIENRYFSFPSKDKSTQNVLKCLEKNEIVFSHEHEDQIYVIPKLKKSITTLDQDSDEIIFFCLKSVKHKY